MEIGVGVVDKARLFVIAIISILLISLSGFLYYKYEKKKTQIEKCDDLMAIAKLKIDGIVQWKKERLSEAIFFSHNENVINQTNRLLNGNSDAGKLISKEIVHILSNKRYANIFILNTKGTVVYTIDTTFHLVDDFTLNLTKKAVKDKTIVFSDFFKNKKSKAVFIDLIAPIIGKDSAVLANLVFRINPEDYLYPLIQSWPVPSKTAETLIVRKDSDSVTFLNRLKYLNVEPLSLKISLKETNIPAIRAVLGNLGMFEGKDYRGKKVLAELSRIPDSSWFMVSKVDQDEIYGDLYSKAILVGVIALIALLLVFFIIAWTYEYKQRNLYKELFNNKAKLRESQEEFRTTLYSIGDGVITTDRRGLVKQMNPVAEKLTGWLEKDAKGRKLEEIFPIINEENRNTVENPVEKVLKEGLIVGLANHTLLISRNGDEIPIADSGAPIRDDKNKVVGVVLVFRDQTEERKQKKALEESRERFAHLFERAPLGYQSLDENGSFIEVNQAWLDTLGYTKEEVIGKWFGDFLAPAYVNAFRERFPQFKKLGKIHSEFEMIHKDGDARFIAFDGRIGYKNDGEFEKTHCILKDITEQKLVFQKLHDSEEKFRLVLESSIDAILIAVPDGKILSANKAACEMFEMTEEEICKAGRDGITMLDERLDKLLKIRGEEGSAKGELTMIRKSGEQFPVELSSSIFLTSKGNVRTSIVIRDITERKRMEESLHRNEEKFRNIFDQHVAVKLIIDPFTGNIFDANQAAAHFYGWSQAELKQMNISQINTLKVHDLNKRMEDALSFNEKVFEFKHRKADGSIVDVEVYSSKVTIQNKVYLHSIIHDISEKKKAEEELKISRNKVNLILNSAAEGIYGIDMEGNCTFCNKSTLRMLGYSKEDELIGKNMHKLIHYKHKDNSPFPSDECKINKTLMSGEEIHVDDDVFWNKEGESFPIEYWSHPIISEKKLIGSVVTFVDTTERRKWESERFKLLNILESSMNEIYIFDSETLKFEYLNRGALKNIGYSIDEIKNLTPLDIKPEFTIDLFNEIIKPLLDGEKEVQVFQTKHKRKNGSVYPVEAHLQLHKVGDRKVFFAVINDITERKKFEEDLIQNEKKLSSIYDTVGDVLYYIAVEQNNKFRFVSINSAFCRVTGLPEEMIIGKLVNDVIPEPSLSMVLDKYNEAIKQHKIVRWEETSTYPTGTLTGEVSIAPVYDDDGKCNNLVGSVHDITERKNFEIELSKSKLFIETIIDNLPIGLAVNTVKPDVSFEYMNDNFLKIYQTSREKIASPDTFWDAIYEDPIQREQIKKQVLSDVTSGNPDKMYWPDIPLLKDGGISKYISARNIPLYDKNLMISTVWDVTEQKLAEEQIKDLNFKLNLLITTLNQLTTAQSIEEIEQIVTTSSRKLIGSDGCTFVLRDGDFCSYVDEDAISPLWKGKKFPLTSCISGWVMLNKKEVVIPDIYVDERIPIDAYKPTFVKSLVMVPINTNQPCGAIGNYWSKSHVPTEDEIKLIETLADATSRVYENLIMYEDLENKVKEKTKELNEHIEELERFHDATIDRELRIKELKDEIERLKGKI